MIFTPTNFLQKTGYLFCLLDFVFSDDDDDCAHAVDKEIKLKTYAKKK